MTPPMPRRLDALLLLYTLACVGTLALGGCATTGGTTGPDSSAEATADSKPAADSAHPDYGDDAMGAALEWTARLPDSADTPTAAKVAGDWTRPTLTRLVRRSDGSYTGVITDSDVEGSRETRAKALVIRIERRDGPQDDTSPTWKVTGTEVGSPTAFWPTTK